MIVAGVISDTHGLVRAEVLDLLRGVDVLLHAGDVGSPEVLDELLPLGRIVAVRGNVDQGDWARRLKATEALALESAVVYLLHDLQTLDLDPRASGIHAVVSGHSHRPVIEWKDGVLYFNPGSAGPRRFRLPVTVGRLTITGSTVTPEILELAP